MLKNKKKIVLVLAVVFAMSAMFMGCAGSNNIGVVDTEKVMTTSPKVKALQDQLNTKGKELSDQLDKEKAGLSQPDFQKKQEAAYGDFLKTKQELEKEMEAELKKAIEKVSKEKNMNVVLYKNVVAHGGTDITDEVIKNMQ